MTNEQRANLDAKHEAMINECLKKVREIMQIANRGWVGITYVHHVNEETFKQFSLFQIQYHHIHTGESMFFIWDNDNNDLLYTVNVTGDSVLTAIQELMDLIGRKF